MIVGFASFLIYTNIFTVSFYNFATTVLFWPKTQCKKCTTSDFYQAELCNVSVNRHGVSDSFTVALHCCINTKNNVF